MQPDTTPSKKVPFPITARELLNSDWPEEVFIEGGLLSRGDCLLIGAESKGGKSTLIAGLMRQLITGGEFLGFRVVKPLRLLYMQAELRESRLKERFMRKYKDLPDDAQDRCLIWSTRGVVMIEEHHEIVASAIQRTKPDVVFIDPMVNFHSHNENDATEMSKFMRQLDKIQYDFNVALVMAHHFRKAPDKRGNAHAGKISLLEQMRGSSALRGWADTTIAMEGRTADEYRRLEFETRNNDEPISRLLKYNKTTREFDWHDPVAQVSTFLTTAMAGGLRLSTMQFLDLLIKEQSSVVGRHRNRVFEIKETLVNSGFLLEEHAGKAKFLRLA